MLTLAALAAALLAASTYADVPRYSPSEIAVDNSGNVYVIMSGGSAAGEGLFIYAPDGTTLKSYLKPGCSDVAIDSQGIVYVTDLPHKQVERLEKNGSFSVVWQETDPDHFINYFAIDRDDDILLSDFNYSNAEVRVTDGWILKISPEGRVTNVIHGDSAAPLDKIFRLSASDNGTIYLTNFDHYFSAIYPDGSRSMINLTGPGNGTFNHVADIEAGQDGYLYVGETFDGRVRKLTPNGTLVATWDGCGPDRFITPSSIVAGRDGRVYVSDVQDQRIVWFDGTRYRYGDNVTENMAGKGVLWDDVIAGNNTPTSQNTNSISGGTKGTPGFAFAGALVSLCLTVGLLCRGRKSKD